MTLANRWNGESDGSDCASGVTADPFMVSAHHVQVGLVCLYFAGADEGSNAGAPPPTNSLYVTRRPVTLPSASTSRCASLARVETKSLLVEITEQVQRLDTDMGALETALQERDHFYDQLLTQDTRMVFWVSDSASQ